MSEEKRTITFDRLLDGIAILISLFAVGFSVVASNQSLLFSERTNRQVAIADTHKSGYEVYFSLAQAQIDHPHQTHLFATTLEHYKAIKQDILTITPLEEDSDKTARRVRERGMAHYIFTAFERAIDGKQKADAVEDKERSIVLGFQLDYFKELVCNPRLQWYWMNGADGGRLELYFDTALVKYIETERNNGDPIFNGLEECKEFGLEPDPTGPFKP